MPKGTIFWCIPIPIRELIPIGADHSLPALSNGILDTLHVGMYTDAEVASLPVHLSYSMSSGYSSAPALTPYSVVSGWATESIEMFDCISRSINIHSFLRMKLRRTLWVKIDSPPTMAQTPIS